MERGSSPLVISSRQRRLIVAVRFKRTDREAIPSTLIALATPDPKA